MNKKFLISWAVVFVGFMAGGFLVHGFWLDPEYRKLTEIMRSPEATESLTHWMLLAHIMLAGGFVWIYQRGNEAKPWLPQGLRFGIAVAIMAPIPTYLMFYVVQQLPGGLAVRQMIGDSILVVLLALITAFLNRRSE